MMEEIQHCKEDKFISTCDMKCTTHSLNPALLKGIVAIDSLLLVSLLILFCTPRNDVWTCRNSMEVTHPVISVA